MLTDDAESEGWAAVIEWNNDEAAPRDEIEADAPCFTAPR